MTTSLNLRCARCGHALKWKEARPIRLLAVFRRPRDGEVLRPPDCDSLSRRCRDCGWVNLFEVMDLAESTK